MNNRINNEQIWKNLIIRLEEIAKKKEIEQIKIAEKTGMSQSSIARFFSQRHSPNLRTFIAIAQAIEVNFFFEDKMSLEILKTMNKEQVYDYIRKRLKFKGIENHLRHVDSDLFENKEHKRFEMSGYESKTGECLKHNLSILNLFAYLGIYDFTSYLFLDFYKGTPTLYLKYFHENENLEFEYSG